MKKLIASLMIVLAVVAITTSCKKTVKAVFPGATTDLPEVTDTLPALDTIMGIPIPLNTTFDLPRITQSFNLDSIVRANTGNNFGAGDITSVKLERISLKIVKWGDSTNNIANFQNAAFSFSSSSNANKTTVSSVTFPDQFSLATDISGAGTPDLRPYLDGKELYYDVSASLRRRTTHPMKISIIATVTMR